MTETAEPDWTDPSAYRHWCAQQMRFADMDVLGHINNVAICVYLESARVAYFEAARLRQERPGLSTVVAHLAVTFVDELTFPGTAQIGTRLTRLGRASFAYRQGVFKDGRCAATADTVSVLFDLDERRSTPLTEGQRRRLQEVGGRL